MAFTMTRPKFFRDPIHLQIRFDGVDVKGPAPLPGKSLVSWAVRNLINCSEFQRLRHTRQNGLANWVFHGAEHTRFPHSIGSCYMAGEMYDRIIMNSGSQANELERVAISCGALLHDIGHGPFSHTLEECMEDLNIEFKHETMSERILLGDTEVHNILERVNPGFAATVADRITGQSLPEQPWAQKIVSSQLDADRLDYTLRDAHAVGLQGHSFDLPRLLDMLTHEDGAIAVDRRAIEAVEAFLVALDHLYRIIYYHHTVRGASRLLSSTIRRAVWAYHHADEAVLPKGTDGSDHPLLQLSTRGSELPVATYLNFLEFHVWSLVHSWQFANDRILADLATRVMQRKVLKTVPLPEGQVDANSLQKQAVEFVIKKFDWVTTEEEAAYYVAFDEPERTSYKNYNWHPAQNDKSIWLVGRNVEPRPIEGDEQVWLLHGLMRKRVHRRLVVPAEVHAELRQPRAAGI